jgi:hypothetical protein
MLQYSHERSQQHAFRDAVEGGEDACVSDWSHPDLLSFGTQTQLSANDLASDLSAVEEIDRFVAMATLERRHGELINQLAGLGKFLATDVD